MARRLFAAFILALLIPASGRLSAQPPAPTNHVLFRVTLGPAAPGPFSGRVLIFLKQGSGAQQIDVDPTHPAAAWVTAREVHDLAPGASIEVDGSDLGFPGPISSMPAGDYEAQAVLDPDHSYNYSGRGPQDWVSAVLPLPGWPGVASEPVFIVDHHPEPDPSRVAAKSVFASQAKPGVAEQETFPSPALTQFWGRPTAIQAWVILPPGYADHPGQRFPTVFWTHGFGGNLDSALASGIQLRSHMEDGSLPPMIWVMLNESCPQGTHEFADSVNTGPWGTALTREFIPALEKKYRMDARPTGRFLTGHSSGGWATLQLQVNYPQIFGGTWSTSPDPSDFHDFTGVDLYAPGANMYHSADGKHYPIWRDHEKVLATMEQFARMEDVLGPYGGQMTSFDWVFSPRSDSGAPVPMFDRETGAVDPAVVQYWHDHFDLAHLVEATWPQRQALLKGRIHVIVGTADTFYLDGAAHKFEARLAALGAQPHFTYLPGKTHFDLYAVGDDRNALMGQIAKEMYAVARPAVKAKLQGK